MLPDSGFVRIHDLTGYASSGLKRGEPLIPVSNNTLSSWVKAGRFPQPVKLGGKIIAWRVEDVRAWMAAQKP